MPKNDNEWQDHAEQKLWELVEGATVTTEKLDKDGNIHQLTSTLPPNVDAIKFVLKNRSKGKWTDKIEVAHTQLTLNLTASYKEVQQIVAQQAPKQLIQGDIIDGETQS